MKAVFVPRTTTLLSDPSFLIREFYSDYNLYLFIFFSFPLFCGTSYRPNLLFHNKINSVCLELIRNRANLKPALLYVIIRLSVLVMSCEIERKEKVI